MYFNYSNYFPEFDSFSYNSPLNFNIYLFDGNEENSDQVLNKGEDNIDSEEELNKEIFGNQINNPKELSLKRFYKEKTTAPFTNSIENLSNSQIDNNISNKNIESPFFNFDKIVNILEVKQLKKIKKKLIKGKFIEITVEYKHVELGIFIKIVQKINASNEKYYI